jgi:hypothetical protein
MYTSCVTEGRFDHPIKGEWEVQKHFEPLDGYLTCHIINKDVYSTGRDPWDTSSELDECLLLDIVRRRLEFVLIHPSSPKNLSCEKMTLDGSNQHIELSGK